MSLRIGLQDFVTALGSHTSVHMGGFLKLGVSFGVPTIIGIVAFWGLHWAALILGNYF